MKIQESYKSRKVQISLLLLVISSVAMFTQIATFAEWSTFINILFGTYFTANVVEKFNSKTE